MGGSSYLLNQRMNRAVDRGYDTKPATELFSSKLHESLSPLNIRYREARDSENHPNSLPIIIGLDVTGSMGKIPHNLLQKGLPTMMSTLIDNGLNDAAICFVAVGDHKSDKAPIQIAQFESGDEELDRHLENTWLEGNGGGNGGESYFLPWYFASRKTVTDSWEKRKVKGFIFTIGDEHCHRSIDAHTITRIFGDGCEAEIQSIDLLREAQEKYHVFHLNLSDNEYIQESWVKLIGENNIRVKDYYDIPKIIANKILEMYSPIVNENITPEKTSVEEDETRHEEVKITL